ncbi:MAG: hypothetical protein EXS31_05175, partial [Pedosphaera sp.]|nr:hypothetical protein [Pedosphaera sp.]
MTTPRLNLSTSQAVHTLTSRHDVAVVLTPRPNSVRDHVRSQDTAFMAECGSRLGIGRRTLLLVATLALASGVSAQDFSGTIVSVSPQSPIQLGQALTVTVVVKNTGTAPWVNFSDPNWVTSAERFGWATRLTGIDNLSFEEVWPGELSTNTFSFKPADLPGQPGTYSFILHCFHPANEDEDGMFTRMDNSPKPVTFTIASSEPASRLIKPAWSKGSFHVSTQTAQGTSYALEFKSSLTATTWTRLDVIHGDGSIMAMGRSWRWVDHGDGSIMAMGRSWRWVDHGDGS